MLKDLTKDNWLKILSLSEEQIPHTLILRGTRNLTEKYENHKRYFNNVRDLNFPNGIFENIFIGEYNGSLTAFASVYGAPMASEVVHLFGVLGTSLVIHTGCCGGLDRNLKTGDIFVPIEAVIGEGSSQYYLPNKKIVTTTLPIIPEQYNVKTGKIYTTSALLAESNEDIKKWRNQGCSTIDMETSAVYATAEYFNMKKTSVLFVFDNPRNNDHLFIENENKTNKYSNGHNKIIDITLFIANNHNNKKRKI